MDGSHLEPIADRDYMARGGKHPDETYSPEMKDIQDMNFIFI